MSEQLTIPLEYKEPLISGNVKAAMSDAGAKSRDLWFLKREDIHIKPGFNVREKDKAYWAHVTNIAESIRIEGFYVDKPLAGYVEKVGDKSQVVLTDGHCRVDAVDHLVAQGIDIGPLPVIVKSNATSLEDLTVALVKSNGGKPLTPYELGIVCKRLNGYGWDEDTIATRLCFTKTYVTDLLFLMGTPAEVRGLVQSGQVSASTAIGAVRKHGASAIEKLTGAVTKAKSEGKAKATAKHLDGFDRTKELKKAAPVLLDALYWVKDDPSYDKLDEVTRFRIEHAIAPFPEVKE